MLDQPTVVYSMYYTQNEGFTLIGSSDMVGQGGRCCVHIPNGITSAQAPKPDVAIKSRGRGTGEGLSLKSSSMFMFRFMCFFVTFQTQDPNFKTEYSYSTVLHW